MILSDHDIIQEIDLGNISVWPFDPNMVQPASIDVHLGSEIRIFNNSQIPYIDSRCPHPQLTTLVSLPPPSQPYILHPGQFILGSTAERVRLPAHIVGRIEGKSSLGRIGLVIHATAGFIDPGFRGPLTLEISNFASMPIALYQGMPIGQIAFMPLSSPANRPYGHPELGSHYQDQQGPTPAAPLPAP